MDWYSWLSRTTLDTSLLYEYNLVFTHYELQKEDMVYFTHDFLLSLGITVAKHRLEMLKLVQNDLEKTQPNGFGIGKLVLAFKKKTKKIINKWMKNSSSSSASAAAAADASQMRRIPFREVYSKGQSVMVTCKKNVTKSGPLDRGMVEQMMNISDNNKWISLSGPLDGNLYRMSTNNQSPTRQGHGHGHIHASSPMAKYYCGDFGNLSPWSLMFHDMKPT